ncbi:Synergin gamma [Bienertia sinuspersici]
MKLKIITFFPSFVAYKEATSKSYGKGNRGKYKSYVVDMKIKRKESKLTIEIPDEINQAFGENARHLVNECGRIVRTRASLNVKNWQETFSIVGDSMWNEIQVVDTMQRLYRLWKLRLHYYYKSPKCGKTDQGHENNPPPDLPIEQWKYCVKHYGSDEFKCFNLVFSYKVNLSVHIVSERNSKSRMSDKKVIHTTGNLAFANVETKENDNVKPSTGVVWLIEHTRKNKKDKLKHVVTEVGDTMTQEEILIQVLEPRSGYIRRKGTTLRNYVRGKQQLEQRKLVEEQQGKIQEQQKRIKELQESQERKQREFEEHKAKQAADMEAFKQDLLLQLVNRGV